MSDTFHYRFESYLACGKFEVRGWTAAIVATFVLLSTLFLTSSFGEHNDQVKLLMRIGY